ncbi:MAG: phage holin family protein [Bacteroidales bacterium]
MKLIIRLIVTAAVVLLGAYLIPGISVDSFFTAIIVAIVLGLLNTFIKPILVFFTIPITILTFGLFYLVINVAIILLAGNLISGFVVEGFWPALFFSLFLSIIGWILIKLVEKN